MPSSLSRLEIVQTAVKQAGRSAELYSHSKLLLNNLLRSCALQRKYRVLKKFGSEITLLSGSDTAALPADFGAAFDSLTPTDGRSALTELEMDEFNERGGLYRAGNSNGAPSFFTTDKEASIIRFNCVADRNYSFIPVYWKLPAPYSIDATDDNSKIWYEDDLTIIEGLIAIIYQYTDDQRQNEQMQKFDVFDSRYRAGTQPIQAGSSKIRLSSSVFRTRASRGWR